MTEMVVESYAMKAWDGSGRHVCMATLVRFEDGTEVRFSEKMSKRAAIKAAVAYRERQARGW